MPWTPFPQDVVGHLEGVHHAGPLLGDLQEPVVGDDDEGVDVLLEALDALLGVRRTPAALEGERPRDDPDGQRSRVPGYLGDDRGSARAGPATLARGDEDHVGTAHRLLDLRLVLLRGLHPDLRVRAGAEAARDLLPYVDLLVGITHLESLGIRVYRYELNPLQTGVDHAVHGVGPPSANADNFYDRQIISRRVQHAYLTLHHTFVEAHGSTSPGTSP